MVGSTMSTTGREIFSFTSKSYHLRKCYTYGISEIGHRKPFSIRGRWEAQRQRKSKQKKVRKITVLTHLLKGGCNRNSQKKIYPHQIIGQCSNRNKEEFSQASVKIAYQGFVLNRIVITVVCTFMLHLQQLISWCCICNQGIRSRGFYRRAYTLRLWR